MHGCNAAKNACFDHEQVRDQTNAFFAAIASVLVMKFKALEQLIFVGRGPIHGAVDHESLLLIF